MRRLLALPLLVLLVLLPAGPADAQRTFPAAASTAPLSCDGTNCTLASGQWLGPAGTIAAPTYSATGATSSGMSFDTSSGRTILGYGGVAGLALSAGPNVDMRSDATLGWASSGTITDARDTVIARPAAGISYFYGSSTAVGATVRLGNTNVGYEDVARNSEAHTLAAAGTSTTATAVWPANSGSLAASFRITTEITGCTSVQVGVAGDATRYGTFSTLTAGQTIAIGRIDNYTAATGILFTAVGGGASFTAGVIRVNLRYVTASAPTS